MIQKRWNSEKATKTGRKTDREVPSEPRNFYKHACRQGQRYPYFKHYNRKTILARRIKSQLTLYLQGARIDVMGRDLNDDFLKIIRISDGVVLFDSKEIFKGKRLKNIQ